jgi:selenocysteine lyase/cysteine desulfurase
MIYLDNAATSFPKPESVYQAMDRAARTSVGNPGRSGHRMATGSERLLGETRVALNRLFNGEDARRWAFTLNCTDALNIAIKGSLRPGDHAITSDLEHNSVSRPLRRMERDGLITLTRVPSHDGYLDPEDVRRALRPETRLVALTHASNVLGTIQPIEVIAPLVREAGALMLVDAAQSAGVVRLDLRATPVDLLAFPGHKALYGPTGTGALYVGPRALPRVEAMRTKSDPTEGLPVRVAGGLRPWREGGTGGDSSSEVQPELLPHFLEGGTPNVLGIIGLAAGIAWVEARGPEANRRHEVELLQRVADWVDSGGDGWRIAGRWDPDRHVGALSLIPPDGFDPRILAGALDSHGEGIAVRPGLHCAPYAHRRLGTFPEGTLRLSPGPFNTAEEIDTFLSALAEITAGVL